jgi:hypothetical protein
MDPCLRCLHERHAHNKDGCARCSCEVFADIFTTADIITNKEKEDMSYGTAPEDFIRHEDHDGRTIDIGHVEVGHIDPEVAISQAVGTGDQDVPSVPKTPGLDRRTGNPTTGPLYSMVPRGTSPEWLVARTLATFEGAERYFYPGVEVNDEIADIRERYLSRAEILIATYEGAMAKMQPKHAKRPPVTRGDLEAGPQKLRADDPEPEYPGVCESCGTTYLACTRRIKAGKKACCSTCASMVTHDQKEWEEAPGRGTGGGKRMTLTELLGYAFMGSGVAVIVGYLYWLSRKDR